MSGAFDLTRWNRAGLSRFRYLDLNAAGYLEELRLALVRRFPEWKDLEGGPPDEGTARLARLLAQYFEEEPQGGATGGRSREAVIRLRRDPAWQIARAVARALHVTGESLDAYANEGFLRTATQLDSVRRLVALLDVHPAPPASATTVLVLAAKGAPGTVEAGFQVQHTRPEGGPPIVFETLADVEMDPALNAVRLADASRSEIGEPTDAKDSPWIAGEASQVSAGQLAILVKAGTPEQAAVVAIGLVEAASRRIVLQKIAGQPPWETWTRGETRLLARPGLIAQPQRNGIGVVSFAEAHDLSAGEVVAWKAGEVWTFATVRETGESTVRLEGTTLPAPGIEVFRALRLDPGTDGRILLPPDGQAAAKPTAGGFAVLARNDFEEVTDDVRLRGLSRVKDRQTQEIRFVPKGVGAVGRTVATAGGLLIDGKPGALAADQWTIGDDGTSLHALRIDRITVREDHSVVELATPVDRLVRLHALFAETLRPEGHDSNTAVIVGTRLSLDLATTGGTLPRLLVPGRELVVERQDGQSFAGARRARVQSIQAVDARTATIEISPALTKEEGFTAGTTVIRGNLVAAGHGESKPEKVLGSGDATRSSQTLVLAQKGVSFVADATQPSGVRAAVEVRVEGETWQQVASLRDSRPIDPHYAVRVTEDGDLAFVFGDGRHGRRLPTGTNNVRVRFRTGSGLVGNLPAESLVKPKRPHRLVDSVRQPFAATGGNDREPIESLRENAPASVLTLERAVSLADFTHLAARQASVWQARAFPRATGLQRQASIEVVVVPAGGGDLGDLAVTLRDTLLAHALPGVDIQIKPFERAPFNLSVTVQAVSSRFDLAEVRERVRVALLDAFSLRRRGLGQNLFLSEVVAVVEQVQGVENSASALNGKPGLQLLTATDRQVLHLDPAASTLDVVVRELEL